MAQFLLIFFLIQIHALPLHSRIKTKSSQPHEHRVTHPKRAPPLSACLHTAPGGRESMKLWITHLNFPRGWAAMYLSVTILKNATLCRRTSATSVAGECQPLRHLPCSSEDTSSLPFHHYTKKMPCSTQDFHRGDVVFSPPDQEFSKKKTVTEIISFLELEVCIYKSIKQTIYLACNSTYSSLAWKTDPCGLSAVQTSYWEDRLSPQISQPQWSSLMTRLRYFNYAPKNWVRGQILNTRHKSLSKTCSKFWNGI